MMFGNLKKVIVKRLLAMCMVFIWLLLLGCSSEKGSQLTAYEVYSELYGEYVCQDEDGGLSMRIYPKGKATYEIQPEEPITYYEGNDLSVVIDGIGETPIGYAIQYTVTNHTGKNIRIENEMTSTQMYIEGQWWELETMSNSMSLQGYRTIPSGESQYTYSMVACNRVVTYDDQNIVLSVENVAGDKLPQGLYRIVTSLKPFDDSYLVVEFEHKY